MDSPKQEAAYDELFSLAAFRQLGEAHLRIIRSERRMNGALHEVTKNQDGLRTSHFGRLVAGDEIAWWVRERIDSLDVQKARTIEAREALQKLLEEAKALQSSEVPMTYLGLVASVCRLGTSNAAQIGTFLEFVKWLEECDPRGPSILFTYKVWGSTRLAEREFHGDPEGLSDEDRLRICIEWATGFRTGGSKIVNKVRMDVSGEIADSIDPEDYSGPISVTTTSGYATEWLRRLPTAS